MIQKADDGPNKSIRATVIVPVYNDGDNLNQCLPALAASRYPDFDVLVVDDGSTDPVKPLVDRFGYGYLRIDGPGGPARARNRAVRHVDSEYVIFIDADVCVYPDTIERMMCHFIEDPALAAVVGTYDDDPSDTGFVSQYRNMLHHYTHSRSAGQITTFWTGCGAMRRDVFIEYGGFDEERYRRPAIEDIELGSWIAVDGGRILLDESIQCKHLKRWTLINMIKTDVFQRGIPWVDLMLRNGKTVKTLNVTGPQRLSVGLFAIACVLAATAVLWPWALIGTAVILIAVTLINLALYRFFAGRRGRCFAAFCLLLHWLYFCCCGVSVVAAVIRFYTMRARTHHRPVRQSELLRSGQGN